MAKLSASEIQRRLGQLAGWSLSGAGEMTKTYTLAGFAQALMFVNAVGWWAEAAQHHPDILVQWNRVTLTLSTHDEGGLTTKDVALAEQIEALPGL